jgi:hypothetical protein
MTPRERGYRLLWWTAVITLLAVVMGPEWYYLNVRLPNLVPEEVYRLSSVVLVLAFVTFFAGTLGNGLGQVITGHEFGTRQQQQAAPKWAMAAFALCMLAATVTAIGLAAGGVFALVWFNRGSG